MSTAIKSTALKFISVLCSFFVAVTVAGAGELATPWVGKSPAQSRLILESTQFSASGVNRAGIEIRLDQGWWTYWRAPGSSGMPPMFDWSGSENLADPPETTWPVPLRAVAYGESLNTYRDRVIFPIAFRAADPTKPVKLHLKVAYGACRNMCVPSFAEHDVTLWPAVGEPKTDPENTMLIDAYSGRGPTPDPLAAGMEIGEVHALVDDGKVVLTIRMRGVEARRPALVLVEGDGFLRVAEVSPQDSDDSHYKTLLIKLGPAPKFRQLSGKRIRVTVIDQGRALEQVWVVGAQGSSMAGLGLTPVPRHPNDKPEPWTQIGQSD